MAGSISILNSHFSISMETSSYFLLIPFLYLLTKHFAKKFRALPPSPSLSLPIIGHLNLIKKPRIFAHLADKYGPILMLYFGSRPVLLVSSPSAVEECLTKNDIVFANRPKFLAGKYLGYNYTTLIWASYGQHWRNLRKIATVEILSSNRIQMFTNVRSDEVRSMIHRLLRAFKGDEYGIVEMKSSFFELTLNIMMRMIAGKRYYGDEAQKMEEAKRFREMIKETSQVSGATNMADFIPLSKWIGGQSKLEKKLKTLQVKRDKFMQDLIEERRKIICSCAESDDKKNKTMIDVLLSLQEIEPEYYKDEIIRGMAQVILSAGSDTTASTLEWALALLLNNPKTLKKAQEEIDAQTGKSRLMNDSDLDRLPYLHAIIDETLRLYPASTLIAHHESSKDCIVGGFCVPRGTILFVNLRYMQNNPKYWEEPTKFKPERFFNSKMGETGFEFMPFGYGRRGCPGESLAKRVVGLALGSLIQCFEWARISEELVDMSEDPGFTVPRAQPLLAKCMPRPEMVKLLPPL